HLPPPTEDSVLRRCTPFFYLMTTGPSSTAIPVRLQRRSFYAGAGATGTRWRRGIRAPRANRHSASLHQSALHDRGASKSATNGFAISTCVGRGGMKTMGKTLRWWMVVGLVLMCAAQRGRAAELQKFEEQEAVEKGKFRQLTPYLDRWKTAENDTL